MSFLSLKCRKCRLNLVNGSEIIILSGHNEKVGIEYFTRQLEGTDCLESNSVYLLEEGLPDWIVNVVNEAGWLKGKLHCPSCALRLGSFNFVSGRKCACGKFVLPPVHIIKSKVDWASIESPTST